MNTLKLMVALVLACALSANARPITLSESIDLAVQHSLQLKEAEASRQSSVERHVAAKAERYPTVGVEGSALYKSEVAQLNINIPGIFQLDREIGSKENYQLDITASLPVYTGGRISSAISAARSFGDLQDAMARASAEQVVLEARVAYFTLFGAQSLLEASQASLTRVQIASRSIYSLFEAGAADSTDLLESRLALNEATFALKQAVINRRSAEIRLLVLLGLSLDESLQTRSRPVIPQSIDQVQMVAVSKPELAAATAEINMSQANLRSTRAGWFPSVSILGGYSAGQPNIDQFGGDWSDYYSVGARLTWSFNTGKAVSHRVKAARIELDASRYRQEKVQETLTREAALAHEGLKLAYEKYMSINERFRISADNYRLAGTQHGSGDLSSDRLLEIEQDLSAAQASLAAAVADYQIIRSAYLYALGSPELMGGK